MAASGKSKDALLAELADMEKRLGSLYQPPTTGSRSVVYDNVQQSTTSSSSSHVYDNPQAAQSSPPPPRVPPQAPQGPVLPRPRVSVSAQPPPQTNPTTLNAPFPPPPPAPIYEEPQQGNSSSYLPPPPTYAEFLPPSATTSSKPPPPPRQHQPEPEYAEPAALSSQLPPPPRARPNSVCFKCKEPVAGQMLTFLGKDYHPEHFNCTRCGRSLGEGVIHESEGLPYCETDYRALFSPKCNACGKPVEGGATTAMGKLWHPQCFVCKKCHKPVSSYVEHEGSPYCREDYTLLLSKKCGKCGEPVVEESVSAMGITWHPRCFTCYSCHQPFVDGQFFHFEGQPLCLQHYAQRSGNVCVVCTKPLEGQCITFRGQKFHPNHFTCTLCKKPLSTEAFMERQDKPYCKPCHVKLFG